MEYTYEIGKTIEYGIKGATTFEKAIQSLFDITLSLELTDKKAVTEKGTTKIKISFKVPEDEESTIVMIQERFDVSFSAKDRPMYKPWQHEKTFYGTTVRWVEFRRKVKGDKCPE